VISAQNTYLKLDFGYRTKDFRDSSRNMDFTFRPKNWNIYYRFCTRDL